MLPKNKYYLTDGTGKRISPDASKKFTEALGTFLTDPTTGNTADKICAIKEQRGGSGPYAYRCFISGKSTRVSRKK